MTTQEKNNNIDCTCNKHCGYVSTTNIVAMSPQQTLWLCLHNKHCGYVSTTNIVAMSPQQTLWLCLHNKHCGYVSTTNIVAMSPQQTLWLCLHNKHFVDTSPHQKLSVTVDKTLWFIFVEYQCKSNKLNTLSIIFIRDSQHPDKVYSIQHYVIEFVSDLRQVGGFLRVHGFLHQ
jgi:hypothetical protein